MKKILAALLVLAIVAPAMADVTITATDLGSQKLGLSFTTTGGAVVRGIALKLTITGGNLANPTAYTTPASAFNTFVDYAFTTGAGYTVGMTGQHPIANPTAAGVAAFPATTASVSVGFLDQAGAQAGLASGVIANLAISGIANGGTATVAIVADTLRGGAVVGDNLGTVTVPASVNIAGPVVTDCVKATAPFYADWVAFGKPNCWCFRRQCHGDADGLQVAATKTVPAHWVGTPDLTILTNGWKKPNTDPGFSAFICADFDQTAVAATKTVPAHRVGTPDLTILTTYWKKPDAQNPECPMTNFNFWKN